MADRILRYSGCGGFIRAFFAETTELVENMREHHHTMPVASAALGRTLTAASMMGIMQKGEKDLLTVKITGDGPLGTITVTADSKAQVKGFVINPTVEIPLKPNGKLDVSGAIGNGQMTIMKDLGLKEPYIGTVDLQTGEIAEDFTYYFMTSEQVPSTVGLGVLVDTDLSIKAAGGFIIQLMPFCPDEFIDQLEANLKKITSVTKLLTDGNSLEDIAEILLENLEPEYLETTTPVFTCNCSKEKIAGVLASLPKKDVKSMIDDGETIEVHCDFCNTFYHFTIDELHEIYRHS